MKVRITVTYSAVMDIGQVSPGAIQRLILEDDPDNEFTIFDSDSVEVDEVHVETTK